MSKILFMIDGFSLINRMYYALPPLMNKTGEYTNAIFGMAQLIYKILETYQPTHFCTAFDVKAPTFRHHSYESYKGTRKKTPIELLSQVEPIKEMLEAFGLVNIEMEGFEADDLLGTISNMAEKEGFTIYILTGDKDALQLASAQTRILFTKKGTSDMDVYDDKAVNERYDLTPLQFIDLKGLMGDTSDNIPGIPGIGEKTGIKLLREYGTLENIFLHTDQLKGTLRKKIEDGQESAMLSRKLATIVREIQMDISIEKDLRNKAIDNEKLSHIFSRYEFSTLMGKVQMPLTNDQQEEMPQINTDVESLAKISFDEPIAIKTVVNQGKRVDPQIRSIYLLQKNIFFKVEPEHLNRLKELFESSGLKIWGHGLKDDYVYLKSYGINLENIEFDTKVAAYLLDSNRSEYNLNSIAPSYSISWVPSLLEGKKKSDLKSIDQDTGIGLDEIYFRYLSGILKIAPIMKEKLLETAVYKLFEEIELPLIPVLGDMEYSGIKVNRDILLDLRDRFQEEILQIQNQIFLIAGKSFNVNSPKQLGEILFEELKLPIIKKTKTGYSTNVEVLEALYDTHPIIEYIMKYRTISKLNSTYVEGLLPLIHDKTGRIHSNFHQTTAATGRLSSTDPNLQNIPVRMEQGRELRKVFVAEDGCVFVDADYSQIELRILAHLAQDQSMINAFKSKEDIHTKTASEVFGVALENVTKEMRSAAKAVNFGIVYGISDFGLSSNLGISVADAKIYIKAYLDKYPLIQQYMDAVVEQTKNQGYCTTVLGRRRYIPELSASNAIVRNLGKRLAMNAPIQGSAADIIKLAMIHVWKRLKEEFPKARLILQIHDELLVECPEEQKDQVKFRLRELMENAIELQVYLRVDVETGNSWYDTK